VLHALSKISNLAGVADRSADGPTTIHAFELWISTCLTCLPEVDTAGSLAGCLAAA
jgi:hypothetical protein